MAGISSKALKPNYAENKRKYNGIEYENSFDLNIGETFFRTHDPQVGRWWQIDPKVDTMFGWSPYAAMFNNPIRFIDPLGDVPGDSTKPQNTQQGYHPASKNGLKGFPEAGKGSYNKESGRWRWKLKDGSILEWDKQHGEVEKYDKSGKKHQGSFDPETGEQVKGPVKGRTTNKIEGEGSESKRPWWSPVQLQWHPSSGMGGATSNPTIVEGQKAGLDAIKKPAAAVGGAYIGVKVIEILIVIGTGSAAAPILIL
jgi:RHS repeat-associated protein